MTYADEFLEEVQDEPWYDPTDANGSAQLLRKFYAWLVKKGVAK
jgi:hypothetical protein